MTTLRNSLAISILLHILLFVCVLALAQVAGHAFVPRLDAVQVSLIAPGGLDSDAGMAQKKERTLPVSDSIVVEERQPDLPAETGSEQPLPQQQTGGPAEDADIGRSADESDEGRTDSTRSGPASTEYLGLVEAIERVKKYPRLARERGMEGVVRLRFMLNHSGGVDAVELVKSSGHEMLDSASISAVYRAAPMPYVNGWVEMPMRYVLK